jgi:hypothetical protein
MKTRHEEPASSIAALIVMGDLLGMVLAVLAIVVVGYLMHWGHYGEGNTVLQSIPYPQ